MNGGCQVMLKFRQKPIVIEAMQWNPDALMWYELPLSQWPNGVRKTSYREVSELLGTSGCSKEPPYWSWDRMAVVDTMEGKHAVSPGDWIITGVKGEKYPCKPDIFEATYEPVVEEK
jgi:hypothetical protein